MTIRRQRPAVAQISLAAIIACLALGIAATGGLAWGIACRRGMDETGAVYWICNLAAPWLVVGFVAGALTRFTWLGPVLGAVALAAGILSYYDPTSSFGGDLLYEDATAEAWMAIAIVSGVVFGWAGAAWRAANGLRWFAVALIAAAVAGESVVALTHRGDLHGDSDRAFFIVSLAVAMALPLVLLRHPGDTTRAYLATGGMSVVGVLLTTAALDSSLL